MKENDPLDPLLREWEAPEPSTDLDARMRATFLATRRLATRREPLWKRIWSFRISVPVPVLAGLLLVIAAVLFQMRSAPASQPATVPAQGGGGEYVTRIEAAGFQPLPDGAVRIVRSQDSKKGTRE